MSERKTHPQNRPVTCTWTYIKLKPDHQYIRTEDGEENIINKHFAFVIDFSSNVFCQQNIHAKLPISAKPSTIDPFEIIKSDNWNSTFIILGVAFVAYFSEISEWFCMRMTKVSIN